MLSREFVAPLSDDIKAFFSNRGRRQIATSLVLKDETVGTLLVTVVTDMFPTPYERKWMWGHESSSRMSGINIKHLFVACHARGLGFGSHLIFEAVKLGRTMVCHVYINTPASDSPARRFLRSSGFTENIFWYTPDHTLMVRYVW